ncbi:MAG: Bug family tripartite tricarboxylate transporter substrate binding protein [Micromonosporaceae bacterium]
MTHRHPRRRLLALVAGAAALSVTGCGATGSTTAEGEGSSGCSVFKGETISLVVPFSPGGGYDTYARIVAPHLGKELGAEVVVENQDGAGGLLAINSLLGEKPDGTKIAIMNAVGAGAAAIAKAPGARFDLAKLSYVGRLDASQHLFVTSSDSEFKDFDDVIEAKGFRHGSTGPGAADFVNAHMVQRIFDLDAKVITGFEGSEENALALTKGDIDGMTGDFDSRLPQVKSGDHRPLLIIGAEREKALPDVPTMLEQDLDDAQLSLAEALIDLLKLGRPIVAPPGMPEDRLSCLRDGLRRALDRKEAVAELEKAVLPVSWMHGDRYQNLVERVLDSPSSFQRILKEVYAG